MVKVARFGRFPPRHEALGKVSSAEEPVTVRKDDAPAATQAAITNVAGVMSFSEGGGLIHTTSG